MDLTSLKRKISENALTKRMAEPLLNAYVRARYLVRKQYTADGADREALAVLAGRFGLEGAQVRYFDIGANHYLRGSNSYLSYRRGGRGVLMEADPLLCENLRKKRPQDQVLAAAIVDRHPEGLQGEDRMNFYVCSLGTRSTLDPQQAQELKRQGFKIERVIEIPCLTFAEVAERTGVTPDLLSIDVEGYDLRVLKTVDFERYPVKAIIAEYDGKCGQSEEDMADYLAGQGYELYRRYSVNGLFVRRP